MAGQSQSPTGNLAVTSTRPYLIDFFPFVVSRADRTGGIIVPSVEFEAIPQAVRVLPVHEPSVVRLSVYPL